MADAFIYDHVRTPRGRGKSDGSLHQVTPVSLAALTLSALRDRNNLDTTLIDDVVLGCVTPVGEQGSNIARIAAIVALYAETVPGQQVNRFCASGLEALNNAAAQVMSGQSDAVVAGGVESMSRVTMGSDSGAWFADPAVAKATRYIPQGVSADLLATLDGFSRTDVDSYALQSQQRAAAAWADNRFARSVVPVCDMLGVPLLERDELLRPQATIESLMALAPAFAAAGDKLGFDVIAQMRYPAVEFVNHVHTAGNSSGIVDGAAAILVGTEEFGRRAGLRPRARITGFASIGSEPTLMLSGPALVTQKLLHRVGMHVRDIDLFEVNEAFAAVVMRFMRHFDLSASRVNVNGGSIAMGHPLGATGAMLVGTALDELERREQRTALITLCVGAGMGTATLIERVDG
jgi:acetyl-CoA C-acetyltransferase